MSPQSVRRYRTTAAVIVVVAVVIAAGIITSPYLQKATPGGTTTTTATSTTSCITSPGQPQGAYLRVVHDTNSTPVPGVRITADPVMTDGCASVPVSFTANGTEWYSLNTANIAGYDIIVSYLRHDYNLTMSLGLGIWTCETLYLPSGSTSAVTSAESSCASPSTSTSG